MGEEHGLGDAVGINRAIPARAGLLHKAETIDIVSHDHTELFAQPGSKPIPSSFMQWRWLLVLQLHGEETSRCWKRQDPVGGGWQQAETLPVMTHHRQPRNTWRPSPGFLKKKHQKLPYFGMEEL